MKQERKIAMVVKKVTYAEAELADDNYWANASHAERLNTLYELRKLIDAGKKMEIGAIKNSLRNGED